MIYTAVSGCAIPLGFVGENEVEAVVFDKSAWLTEYGPGTFELVHRRSQDTDPFPVAVTVSDGAVTWTPTESDTAYRGVGECQLSFYTPDGQLKKSEIYQTFTARSLTSAENPPSPAQGWVAQVLAAAAGIQNMQVGAATLVPGSTATVTKTVDPDTGVVTLTFGVPEGLTGATGRGIASMSVLSTGEWRVVYTDGTTETVGNDVYSALNALLTQTQAAQTAAETAQGKAEDAQGYAEAAQTAAQYAQGQAETSSSAAAASAAAAEASATAAANSASTANTAKTDAQTANAAAQGAKTDAASSATAASASATNASSSAAAAASSAASVAASAAQIATNAADIAQISEATVNLWTGDPSLSFTKSSAVSISPVLTAGTYTISAVIVSADTNNEKSRVVFQLEDNTNVVCDMDRSRSGSRTSYTFTAELGIKKATFYAAIGPTTSEGDAASWSYIQIESGTTATSYIRPGKTAVDLVARANEEEILKTNTSFTVDLTAARVVYGTISSEGVWQNVTDKNRSILIPTGNFDSVTITQGSRAARIALLKSDKYPYNGCQADLAEGTAPRTVNSGSTATIALTADTVLLCIMTMSAENDTTPVSVTLTKQKSIISDLTYTAQQTEKEMAAIEDETRSAMDRLDSSFAYVAYSGISASGHSMNTAEYYAWAAKKPEFTAVKGDIRPTLDNKIVMCHDDFFLLDANGDILPSASATYAEKWIIREHTIAELLELKHAATNEHVCSFENYVKACKKFAKTAFITIRDEYIPDIMAELFGTLDRLFMRKNCVFNSFTQGTLQLIRAYDEAVPCSYVVANANLPLTTDRIDFAINLKNCIVSSVDYGAGGDVSDETQAVIDYALQNGVRLYSGVLTQDAQIDQLLDHGYSGAQLQYVPFEA